jgi:hypothetical protein
MKGRDTWPEKSDFACMHDCEKFDTVPIFVPQQYDFKTGKFSEFWGNFCSMGCARQYIHENFGGSNAGQLQLLYLSILEQQLFGKDTEMEHPSEPRIRLKKFGGDLELEEYRNGIGSMPSSVPGF